MRNFGGVFFRSDGSFPVPFARTEIMNKTGIGSSETNYSEPVDTESRVFTSLGVDYTSGTLSSMSLYLQIWTGAAWVKSADAASVNFLITLTATQSKIYLIGDNNNQLVIPTPAGWRFCRIMATSGGSGSGGSLVLRIGSK